jgi:Ca2+-binding EF-hand superfamily protein
MKTIHKVALGLAALAGLGLLGDSEGAAPPVPPRVERPGDDVEDVVFFTEARPVLIRLHVRVNGKAHRVAWENFIDKVFRYLDADGDGVLSPAEARRAPPAPTLFNANFLSRGGFTRVRRFGGGGPVGAGMTRAQLAEHYRAQGAEPFQFRGGGANLWDARTGQLLLASGRMGGGRPSADAMNARLFELLDTDRDGKLSRAELAAAPKVLAKLDANDVEMLTPAELMGNAGQPGGSNDFVAVAFSPDGRLLGGAQAGSGAVVRVNAARSDAGLAKRLLSQYGGKAARRLTAKQIGLDRETFALVDADGNGELDGEELARFHRRAPDLEFTIRLGERGKAPLVEHVVRAGRPLARYVRTEGTGAVVFDLNNTRLELGGPEPMTGVFTVAAFDQRQQYIQQFKAADKDGNGYLDRNEARASPFFAAAFDQMDRDGDGMLYLKEVLAYYDAMKGLSDAARGSITAMSVSDHGQGLFDLLDTDRDGRLSVRELRQLPKLIDKLDRDGDGKLSRHEIPRSYKATFEQGAGGNPAGQFRVVRFANRVPWDVPAQPRTAGPLWFQKMDRNRDGDVSRREFLGTDEQFRLIDTDGDGLISVEEALAFDRARRKR